VETHTAGHVTRILIEPLPGLDQSTLAAKIAYFKDNYDHIRPLLLGEPRGHAAAFGLVPVKSEIADFGAFFLTSYGYPVMGNHAIVGYARALNSLGRLAKRNSFTIEVPSAVLNVELGRFGDPANVTISLPDIRIDQVRPEVELFGRLVPVEVGMGAAPAALVDVASLGVSLEAENAAQLTEIARQIRIALEKNGRFAGLDSVVFYDELRGTVARQFAVINDVKFDRSPGILGAATRAAQLVRDKRVKAGTILSFESLFGDSIKAEVASIADLSGDPKVDVKITAKSHLNAITTFIYEPTDHLYSRGSDVGNFIKGEEQ
jgi:proline racemase